MQQSPVDWEAFRALGIALGLGLLVGLQRERAASRIAGIRTFALITVFGTLSALLADAFGSWVLPAGLLALAALIVVANVAKIESGEVDPGLTTEVAVLLMYAVGAFVATGHEASAVAVAGSVAILLQLKQPLHRFVQRIGEADIRAIMQFVLISLVILPVLPNRTYGPYDVLNPHQVWWMVVLIVGIGMGGYIAYKLVGARGGALLGGVLGGLVSSTATTVSAARRDGRHAGAANLSALVILLASATVFLRILVEVAAAALGHFGRLAPPLVALFFWMVLLCAVHQARTASSDPDMPSQENPAQLGSALVFGALYAVVLVAVAAAKERFGTAGIYAVAALSGLADVDAITLSTARLVAIGSVDPESGWRAILIAALSNLAFKGAVVAALAGSRLRSRVLTLFGVAFLGGVAILWFWPSAQ